MSSRRGCASRARKLERRYRPHRLPPDRGRTRVPGPPILSRGPGTETSGARGPRTPPRGASCATVSMACGDRAGAHLPDGRRPGARPARRAGGRQRWPARPRPPLQWDEDVESPRGGGHGGPRPRTHPSSPRSRVPGGSPSGMGRCHHSMCRSPYGSGQVAHLQAVELLIGDQAHHRGRSPVSRSHPGRERGPAPTPRSNPAGVRLAGAQGDAGRGRGRPRRSRPRSGAGWLRLVLKVRARRPLPRGRRAPERIPECPGGCRRPALAAGFAVSG